eukprot:TRINITY_DN68034_c10_g1_i1.p1 TRINITY_DN68034_c10_g1~~TRINITY_DN68034_c10_g1_i1.p1  ORF type:complete len:257 (-),score=8.83 TRINITY_DN68034_c10_g1_i1:517-1287(-)
MKLVLLLVAFLGAVEAHQIVIAGDSWGTHAHIPFLEMLKRKHSNLTMVDIAVSGTTTKYWADRPNRIRDEVSLQSDAKVVWITLGGNDAKNMLPGCQLEGKSLNTCITHVVEEVIANSKKFLDPLFKAHPNIKVVQFGYDILDMDKLPLCPAYGIALMPKCKDKPLCFNTYFSELQTRYVNKMPSLYPGKFDAIDLRGSMQQYNRDPGVTPGHPNLARYSPGHLLEDNCIHPTSEGFKPILDNFYDLYLHKFEPHH